EEWKLMKRHSIVGADVISRIPQLRFLAGPVRAHHERWDGTGYPDGLAGEVIPLAARIVAVADAFSAITTDRPYSAARSSEEAVLELERCQGSQFDPEVIQALLRVFGAAGDKRMDKAA
ncbi:MAG: HD domain-containing protein, partial [Chlorobia bacterium]|nr:HD domain-containing protein [Fimbriimonadaceae bacterium]